MCRYMLLLGARLFPWVKLHIAMRGCAYTAYSAWELRTCDAPQRSSSCTVNLSCVQCLWWKNKEEGAAGRTVAIWGKLTRPLRGTVGAYAGRKVHTLMAFLFWMTLLLVAPLVSSLTMSCRSSSRKHRKHRKHASTQVPCFLAVESRGGSRARNSSKNKLG